MKLTLGQIVSGYEALVRLGATPVPIKLAYDIQRNARLMEPDYKAREDKRLALIRTKYGVANEAGDFNVPPEKMDEFMKELNSLDTLSVVLDIHTIDMNSLDINMAPNDLYWLDWMFITGDSKKPKKK